MLPPFQNIHFISWLSDFQKFNQAYSKKYSVSNQDSMQIYFTIDIMILIQHCMCWYFCYKTDQI